MKKLMVVLYNKETEVGAFGMKELMNLPSYENKTVKELVEEMADKNMVVKFQYRKITVA